MRFDKPNGLDTVSNVVEFGTTGDGQTLDTESIQTAIDSVSQNGGGTLYFPPGDYLAGTIRLKDNITLYLEHGCTIQGSTDLGDYDPDHKHLFFGFKVRNVVIEGRGAIDGNGPRFWDGGRLERWLSGEADLPRTSDMIRFDHCENITMENIEFRYGAFWNIGFGDCRRITARALTIINGIYEEDGPNTDGINLWNCEKIRISDCDIQTGDDCIVVLGTSRDVNITNCKFTTTETALMISGARNLTISSCTIHDAGCGIGFRVWNGIVVDGVHIDNVVMDVSDKFDTGGQAIYMWSFPLYVESDSEIPRDEPLPPAGTIENVTISNVTARANGGIMITGPEEPSGHIRSLVLENIRITMNGGKEKDELDADPPYPYPIYGFHGAPYAMFLRFIKHLTLRNIHFAWQDPEKPEWGGSLRCVGIEQLEIDGFSGRQAAGSNAPAIWLKHVQRALIRDCCAPDGTGVFLGLAQGTGDITLMNNELSRARSVVTVSDEASPTMTELGNRLPT